MRHPMTPHPGTAILVVQGSVPAKMAHYIESTMTLSEYPALLLYFESLVDYRKGEKESLDAAAMEEGVSSLGWTALMSLAGCWAPRGLRRPTALRLLLLLLLLISSFPKKTAVGGSQVSSTEPAVREMASKRRKPEYPIARRDKSSVSCQIGTITDLGGNLSRYPIRSYTTPSP